MLLWFLSHRRKVLKEHFKHSNHLIVSMDPFSTFRDQIKNILSLLTCKALSIFWLKEKTRQTENLLQLEIALYDNIIQILGFGTLLFLI